MNSSTLSGNHSKTQRRRRVSATLFCSAALAAGLFALTSAAAMAAVCVAFDTVNLNVVIDASGSMDDPLDPSLPPGSPTKHDIAKQVGIEIYNAISATGSLRRAGGMGFPTLTSSAGFVLNMTEDTRQLLDRLNSLPAPDGLTTPLHDALMNSAFHMAEFRDDGNGILVVLTDGIHGGTATSAFSAERALANSGSWNFLVFLGSESVEADRRGSDALRDIATNSGSAFRFGTPGVTATELANLALASACRNWSPNVSARVTPAELNLDSVSRSLLYSASASDDRTDAGNLVYRWYQAPPGGSEVFLREGRGSGGSALSTGLPSPGVLGRWDVRVEVDDGEGGVSEAGTSFLVSGTPPRVEIIGGGAIVVEQDLQAGNRHSSDASGRPQTSLIELVSFPPRTVHTQPPGGWTTPSVSWTTDESDITVLENGSRFADIWRFRMQTTVESGLSQVDIIEVDVINKPPEGVVNGHDSPVAEGSAIELDSTHRDPDGGDMTYTWDIIQAPDAAPADRAPGYEIGSDALFSLRPDQAVAGSWIFRLTATDNEGEEAMPGGETFSILVDALPTADIDGEREIMSLSDELLLDGRASEDPDSPCDEPDFCHTNLEGTPEVSPGIVRWTWSVVDLPPQFRTDLPRHGVDDALALNADQATVTVPAGTLLPGEWTFQLEIEDGEGHVATARHRVIVVDEGGNPVAMVTPPYRDILDSRGMVSGTVAVSARDSHDPDDVRLGRPDVLSYQWRALSLPAGGESCMPATTDEVDLVLFDEFVRPECRGFYRLQVTVTDDDAPTPRSASAETVVQLGDCTGICIDHPTAAIPVLIDDPASMNVPIFYRVDPALFAGPSSSGGLLVRLEIFPGLDLTSPVYSTEEPLFEALTAGSSLGFYVTGHSFGSASRSGTYSIRISVIEPGSGVTLDRDLESEAIAIAGAGRLMDCADLWEWGFPDRREEDAFPCIEYIETGVTTSAQYRIFHPPDWELADPRIRELLEWTSEGIRRSWSVLEPHGGTGPVAVVMSNRYPPEPDRKPVAATATGGFAAEGEPCPVVVYPRGMTFDRDDFRWVIAHELGHCYQYRNTELADSTHLWWREGTASYLGNVIYPDANSEFRYVLRNDGGPVVLGTSPLDPEVPIYQQSYPSVIFFQSLANHAAFGLEGVLDLMLSISLRTGLENQVAAMAAAPGMYDAWHAFVEQIADGRVADTASRFWPYAYHGHTMDIEGETITWAADSPFIRDGSSAARIPAARFTLNNTRLVFQPDWIYTVNLSSVGVSARRSASRAGTLDPWRALPGRIAPGCSSAGAASEDWNLLLSVSPDQPAAHRTRIAISAEPDPACRP